MPKDETSSDLGSLALMLVGEFAIVQESVDHLVSLYIEKRAKGLKRWLKDQNLLNRLSDKQRPRLVLDIAADLETPSDLSAFTDVFHRVKKMRDDIAHSAGQVRIGPDTLRLTRSLWQRHGEPSIDPVVVTREELLARLVEARWLAQHVKFVMCAGGGLTIATYLGDRPIEFCDPSSDPRTWDGTTFVFVNGDTV